VVVRKISLEALTFLIFIYFVTLIKARYLSSPAPSGCFILLSGALHQMRDRDNCVLYPLAYRLFSKLCSVGEVDLL